MTTIQVLEILKLRLKEIQGQWNGKESGLAEDRAMAADEAISTINNLENTLEELNLI